MGKYKCNKRSIVSICCNVSFPAISDVPFSLVLATRSYASALMESSINQTEVNLDELAVEVYSKNAVNIRCAFETILKKTWDIDAGTFIF